MFKLNLKRSEVQRMAKGLELVKYPAGSQIITKGDTEDTTFYIIKAGTVTCMDICEGAAKIPDVELGVGKYFGERALISNEPRAATVVATEDVTLLALEGKNFKAILGGLKTRMAKAVQEEDKTLLSRAQKSGAATPSSAGKMAKSVWKFTTRPEISVEDLQEVAPLGSGSFGYVRWAPISSAFFVKTGTAGKALLLCCLRVMVNPFFSLCFVVA